MINKGIIEANKVRVRRRQVKEGLKRMEVTIAAALEVPEVQGMELHELLVFAPVFGPSVARQPRGTATVTAAKLLAASECTRSTIIKDVGDRRKKLLIAAWLEATAK